MGLIYRPFIKTIPGAKDFDPIQLSLPIHQISSIVEESPSLNGPIELETTFDDTDTEPALIEEKPSVQDSFEEARELIKKRGQHQYKTNDIDVGNMKEFLDLAESEGISFRITSGLRPGAVTSNGNISNHHYGNAIDITPIDGQTWDDLIFALRSSEKLKKYMKDNKMRILDERSKATLAKTKGTGAHFHISFGHTEGTSADDFFA